MVYCIVCVMGPHKIFGPSAPQSLNPALCLSIEFKHIIQSSKTQSLFNINNTSV